MSVYNSKTVTITAQNQFSSPIQLTKGGFIKLSGTFSANVVCQRRNLDGAAWDTITDNSGNTVNMTVAGLYTVNPQNIPGEYRVGCPTGGYTSGTCAASIEGE